MKPFAWLGQLFNRLTSPDRLGRARVVHSGRTPAGIYVDAQTALKNATVFACVQYLSRTPAQLPWRVMRELPGGGAEVVDSNPADFLIHKRPNPEMGSFTFRQTLMTWALLHGNGYAEIQRDNRGAPYALWPLHPNRVTPRRDLDGVLYYEVRDPQGGSVDVQARDMLHIRGFGDGVVGVGIVEFAAETIGWARATEIFGATFFGEGMNPSMVITTEGALTVPAMDQLRKELDRLYKGPKGSRTAIFDKKTTATKLSQTPDESQFIETMQHQVEEICRWFGVPPHKVMHLLRATFSNIEHQAIEVVVDTITPWVKIWEEEADYKLFGANRQGLFTKMNLKGLLRGDSASRVALYKGLFELGAMSTNDVCAAEDLNPVGPQGDQRFVSTNLISLKEAGKPKPPPPAPPVAPKPGEGADPPDDPKPAPAPDPARAAA